jgi:outer membrane protein TolC
VKNKYEQGTASRFDLLQSRVQVSKLMPELIKAKNAVDLIDAELKKLLGLKIQSSVALKDSFAYNPMEIKESEFLETAYLENPGMKLTALGVDANKWLIEAARSGHKPQVNARIGYDYRSNDIGDMVNSRHNNWDAGISVSVPVFDGFSTKAKVDEAGARYARAKLEKENMSEQIAVDIRKACLDLRESQSVICSQKDSVEEAQEALKIAEARYDNGEGTNLDVMDAQVSLSQVEKNLSEGIYDYFMAEAYLNRAMGRSCVDTRP